MPLLDLPNELVEGVAWQLNNDGDISSFSQTCRSVFYTVIPYLYRHNDVFGEGSALFYAAKKGIISTLKRAAASGIVLDRPSLLAVAARAGREDVVRFFLENYPGMVGSSALLKRSPLGWASMGGCLNIVNLLLDYGADIDNGGYCKFQPFQEAVRYGRREVAQLLLDKGADTNYCEATRIKMLSSAAGQGFTDVVELLLDTGIGLHGLHPTDQGSDGWSPLRKACSEGRTAVVELLLDRGADVGILNSCGVVGLTMAAADGHLRIVDMLLKHGVDPNDQGEAVETAMSASCRRGYLECAQRLVEAGANVDMVGTNGRSPLLSAAGNGHREIVEYLIAKKADVDCTEVEGGMTPLMKAAQLGLADIVSMLLEAGCAIDTIDNDGISALHYATNGMTPSVARLLINHGADVKLATIMGHTPLHLAAQTSSMEIGNMLRTLCEAPHCDINAQDRDGRTALHYTAKNGSMEGIETLLSRGARLDILDYFQASPFLLAVRNGHEAPIKYIKAEYDRRWPNAILAERDCFNRSALWWATTNRNLDLVGELIEDAKRLNMGLDCLETPNEPRPFSFSLGECWCNVCTRNSIHDTYSFSCDSCGRGGNFLICGECHDTDAHCHDDSHDWSAYRCELDDMS